MGTVVGRWSLAEDRRSSVVGCRLFEPRAWSRNSTTLSGYQGARVRFEGGAAGGRGGGFKGRWERLMARHHWVGELWQRLCVLFRFDFADAKFLDFACHRHR